MPYKYNSIHVSIISIIIVIHILVKYKQSIENKIHL